MGNAASGPSTRFGQSEVLAELPGVAYKEPLGGGRFLKSSLCVADDGTALVVKVYPKGLDAGDVRRYQKRLAEIRAAYLSLEVPHVLPLQRIFESERSVFLIRQYLFASLTQRLTTRPFLTDIEKRWIAWQLILAVKQTHSLGISHGDIKPANVLVTSWHWTYLTDPGPYKPAHIPADDPADFSLFFDSDGRRSAYLAPERLVEPAGASARPLDRGESVDPVADIFSLGCTLAELFLDGQPLFDFSRLLAYRAGTFDPSVTLARLEPSLRDLIGHMIQRDPGARLGAGEYLHGPMGAAAFPDWMPQLLHPFYAPLVHAGANRRVTLACAALPELCAKLEGCDDLAAGDREPPPGSKPQKEAAPGSHPAAAAAAAVGSQAQPGGGDRVQQSTATSASSSARIKSHASPSRALLARVQDLAKKLDEPRGSEDAAVQAKPASELDPKPLHPDSKGSKGLAPMASPSSRLALQQAPEAHTLLCVLLCTLSRGARSAEARRAALAALTRSALACEDDAVRMQCVLPTLVSLAAATEPAWAGVRGAALRAIAAVAGAVRSVPPGDLGVMAEYVLPSLSSLPRDAAPRVRAEHAAMLADLCAAGLRFVEGNAVGGGDSGVGAAAVEHADPSQGSVQTPQTQPRPETASSNAATSAHAPSAATAATPPQAAAAIEALRGLVATATAEALAQGTATEARLAVLRTLPRLSAVLGPQHAADGVLPTLLSLFGSGEAGTGPGRAALLAALPGFALALGPEGTAALLLPFLEREVGPEPDAHGERRRRGGNGGASGAATIAALAAAPGTSLAEQQAARADALYCLAELTEKGLLRRRPVLGLCARVARGLAADSSTGVVVRGISEALAATAGGRSSFSGPGRFNPSGLASFRGTAAPVAVRAAAVAFWAAAARQLSPPEAYALLRPSLKPCLAREPLDLRDPQALAAALPESGSLRVPVAGDAEDAGTNGSGEASETTGLGSLRPGPVGSASRPGAGDVDSGSAAPVPRFSLAQSSLDGGGGPFLPPSRAGSAASRLLQSQLAVGPGGAAGDASMLQSLHGGHRLGARGGGEGARFPGSPSASLPRFMDPGSEQGSSWVAGTTARYRLAVDPCFLGADTSLMSAALAQSVCFENDGPGQDAEPGAPVRGRGPGAWVDAEPATPLPDASTSGAVLANHALRVTPALVESLSGALHHLDGASAASLLGSATDDLGSIREDSSALTWEGGSRLTGTGVASWRGDGTVEGAMRAALATELSLENGAAAGWRPRGALVAHFAEHKACVHTLATAPSGAFFVSASADGTARVWDGRRLDRDAGFRSRLTYAGQRGALTGAAVLPGSRDVVTASDDGSLHLWRVETAPRAHGGERYTGVSVLREQAADEPGNGVTCLAGSGPNLVLAARGRSGLAAWDAREGLTPAWSLAYDPCTGPITALASDPDPDGAGLWLLTGTQRGVLTLWDVRFRLPVLSWRLGRSGTGAGTGTGPWAGASSVHVHALAALGPGGLAPGVPRTGPADVGPAAAAPPCAYVAAGDGEVGVWNLGTGTCRVVLKAAAADAGVAGCANGSSVHTRPVAGPFPGAFPPPAGEAERAMAAGAALATPPRAGSATHALLTLPGAVLAAGSDRVIRCWDTAEVERSYAVCVPPLDVGGAGAGTAASSASGGGAPRPGRQAPPPGPPKLMVPKYSYRRRVGAPGTPMVLEEQRTFAAEPTGVSSQQHEHAFQAGLAAEQAVATCHMQAVTCLARLPTRREGGVANLLLSASADGVIKAWR